jgi:hypothetical protein
MYIYILEVYSGVVCSVPFTLPENSTMYNMHMRAATSVWELGSMDDQTGKTRRGVAIGGLCKTNVA